MKTVHIALTDTILAGMVEEQLSRLNGITLAADKADLMIANEKTAAETPHLILGGKPSDGCETLSLPLKMGELRDRIRYMLSGRDRFAGNEVIEFSGFSLNLEDGVIEKDGVRTRLTDKEKLILQNLYEADDYQLDRKNLLQSVWGYAESAETHTLETHLYRLRQKLDETFGPNDLITTKDGIYTLKA